MWGERMNSVHQATLSAEEAIHHDNLQLSQAEYLLQHIFLFSRPRCVGLVLGNACNVDCIHCYQPKNGDNVLRPVAIGKELRREFIGLYPYLSTFRVLGGEVFALSGFSELLDDVEATVSRPILSVSTNGTLIDEGWAERIVRLPFSHLTISIDGATPETFARLRRGSRLESVLTNLKRIQRWKEKLGSEFPYVDSFFVVMRSNFREIPKYLQLMREHGISDVSFQTLELNQENARRTPGLERDEALADPAEITELHRVLRDALLRERAHFRMIRASGLRSLFEQHGLDPAFLMEEANGLYPDSEGLAAGPAGESSDVPFDLCPNPWTTLFVVENGDVHLCFLSEAIGNLYAAPLASLWNSPRALAKRSQMIAGRYLASGCAPQYCSWREGGRPANGLANTRELLLRIGQLKSQVMERKPEAPGDRLPFELVAVRRMVSSRDRRIAEIETLFQELCETNGQFHQSSQKRIDELEALLRGESGVFRERPIVRAAFRMSRAWERLTGRLRRR